MRMLGFMWLTLVVACGYGFQPVVPIDGAADGSPNTSPDTPPDSPTVLGCAPLRFQVSTAAQWVTAVGTRRGYDVFVVEDSGAVRGYAYQFVGDQLEQVPGTGSLLAVPSSIGPVAALSVAPVLGDDTDVVIAVPYEGTAAALTTNPTGTIVVPLNTDLVRVDAPAPSEATRNDGLVAIPGGLAGGEDDKIVLLATTDVVMPALQQVSRRGVAIGAAQPVDSKNHKVTRPILVRTASGYLAVWSDNESMPEAVTAAVIGDDLVPNSATVIHSDMNHGALDPFAAYSPAAHHFLFSWLEKVGSLDVIKLEVHNEQLLDTSGVIDTGQVGGPPVIGAADGDFLVAWRGNSGQMVVARVKLDGSFLVSSPTSSGGTAVHFDVAVRNGQPALFWVESARTPNLWIDAACSSGP